MNGSMAAIAASSAAAAQKELAAPGHSFDQLPDVLGSPNLVAPDRELVRRAMIWEIEGAASHTKERIRKSNFGATPASDCKPNALWVQIWPWDTIRRSCTPSPQWQGIVSGSRAQNRACDLRHLRPSARRGS